MSEEDQEENFEEEDKLPEVDLNDLKDNDSEEE